MRIYLSGTGWLTDLPVGNRLRWSYPTMDLINGKKYRGLPDEIIVKRAPLKEGIKYDAAFLSPSAMIPSWWDNQGTINISGFMPLVHRLKKSVQAISFKYKGPKTAFLALNDENKKVVSHRILNDDDWVYLRASAINKIVFLTFPSVELQHFRTLDLFKERGFEWETIAVIKVRESFKASYMDVAKRYDIEPTLLLYNWKDIVTLVDEARVSTPESDSSSDEPPKWRALDLLMGLRWEFALICGFGFFDGPHSQISPLDKISEDKLLRNIPPQAYAYKVSTQNPKKFEISSNIIVCPNWTMPPLSQPSIPTYISPKVALTPEGNLEAKYGMKWSQSDINAIGVEIEEQTCKTPFTEASATTESYRSRSHLPTDNPSEGRISITRNVPFHDVKIRARCRATDCWDRESSYSRWTPLTNLLLEHNPLPVYLKSARHEAGTTYIIRQVGDPDFPDWTPDRVIQETAGKVFIYRKITNANPRIEITTVAAPINVESNLYKTTTNVTNPADFIDGYLIAGNFKAKITDISGNTLFFPAPSAGEGTVKLFPSGSAKLQENPLNERLWTKAAEFPTADLPEELIFIDPVPEPIDQADVLSYHARISYLGRLGPASNIVNAIRIPPTPSIPPPFSVEILGVDFYKRTMIKIIFTNPVTDGFYTIWWADDPFDNTEDNTEFSTNAVPGEYRKQQAENQTFLYDVLPLPIPSKRKRIITIGVQKVNAGGGQSNFMTVKVTLAPQE